MNNCQIIAHRGNWNLPHPLKKNSIEAFESALLSKYGVEIDVRDQNSNLVVEHDLPINSKNYLESYFKKYTELNSQSILALNIKSDGLSEKINTLIQRYNIKNYFVFDMSIPDTLPYIKNGMIVFMRLSEYEEWTDLHRHASGIWLDYFSQYYDVKRALSKIKSTQKVCLVSPELHKFELNPNYCRELLEARRDIYICTDNIPFWRSLEQH